jgi:two-component system, cell cycle sensor histidine kinase and response regulator CckA
MTHQFARATRDVIWTVGDNGASTYVSPSVEGVCGFSADEVLATEGNIWIDRIHPKSRSRLADAFQHMMSGGAPFDAEYEWQRADGSWLWVRGRAAIRIDVDGIREIDGILSDISDRKALEARVTRSQRMETIGQLTGGVAHDFNNLLAIILGHGEYLVEALPKGQQARLDAEVILDTGRRAAVLTKQLLAFSRPQPIDIQVLDLNALVDEMQTMFARVIGEHIRLTVQLDESLGGMRADAGQIEQVLLNLVINARDAMPGGGTLTISTSNVQVDDRDGTRSYVMLRVRDTGAGMDFDTRRKIFEPFFTTKAIGHGTGLGLATCSDIIKQSDGLITVDSEPGRGSAFSVYLPRVSRPAAIHASAGQRPSSAAAGAETVMVVEDDDLVRAVVQRTLCTLGYRVLEARTGAEAEAVATHHSRPIDLILSDIVIPDASGPEVVGAIHRLAGRGKSIFMSGYTSDALLRRRVLPEDAHFIQKPFTPASLATKVRTVLDGGRL